VGIGITSPTAKLHIDQDDEDHGIFIESDATTKNSLRILGNNNASSATTSLKYDIFDLNSGGGGNLYLLRNLDSTVTSTPMVFIEQDNASDDQDALTIQNDGTGEGIKINQIGNGMALNIDSEATTQDIVNIDGNILTSGIALDVIGGTSKTGTIGVARFLNSGNASNVVIDQNGNGIALNIDSEATTNPALQVTASTVTTGPVIEIRNVADMTANDGSGRSGVIYAEQAGIGSTKPVIHAKQDGTGTGLFIDQNGDGRALNIDSEATEDNSIRIISQNAGTDALTSLRYDIFDENQGGGGNLYLLRNLASATTEEPMVVISQDNSGDDQNALTIKQDGTGDSIYIDHNGNSQALTIDSETTGLPVIGMAAPTTNYIVQTKNEEKGVDKSRVFINSPTNPSGSSWFNRDLAAADTAGPVVKIHQDNATDDQYSLSVQQDGTAPGIFINLGVNSSGHIEMNPRVDAPATCTEGTLYADTSGALCYCYTGNTWENLGTHGTCA
jgi:hypothetical protein